MNSGSVAQLQALARYYQAILSSLSRQSSKHLIDLAAVVRYGLTADLGVYVRRPSLLLDEDKVSFCTERMSPDEVTTILTEAVRQEETPDDFQGETPPKASADPESDERKQVAARLIAIYRKQEQDPYNRETILGWPIVAGRYGSVKFCAPLLYFTVHLHYDPIGSIISLTRDFEAPAVNFHLLAKLLVSEDDTAIVRDKLLPYMYRPECDMKTVDEIVRIVSELVPGLRGLRRDSRTVAPLMAVYEARAESGATLFNAIAVINAPRSSAFLQDDLAELAKLDEIGGETVVETILQDIPDNVEDVDNPEDPKLGGPLLYPLLSNRAQRTVARKAELARLMVVQGPPGTGKSQTIANLVCHLVASGKSVLITSHQNKALEVILRLLPNVDHLALSLLKGEKESVAELRTQLERFNAAVEGKSLRTLENSLRSSLVRIEEIVTQIRRLTARFSELKLLEKERAAPYKRYHDLRVYDGLDREDDIPAGQEAQTATALREWYRHFVSLRDSYVALTAVLGGPGTSPDAATVREEALGRVLDLCRNSQRLLARPEIAADARMLAQEATTNTLARTGLAQWKEWLDTHGGEFLDARLALESSELGLQDMTAPFQCALRLRVEVVNALCRQAADLAQSAVHAVELGATTQPLPTHPSPTSLRAAHVALTELRRVRFSCGWYLRPRMRRAREVLSRERLGSCSFRDRRSMLDVIERWVRVWSLHETLVSGVRHMRATGVPLPDSGSRPAIPTLLAHMQFAKAYLLLVRTFAHLPYHAVPEKLRVLLWGHLEGLRSPEELARLRILVTEVLAQFDRVAQFAEVQRNPRLEEPWRAQTSPLATFLTTLEETADLQHHIAVLEHLKEQGPTYRRVLALEEEGLTHLRHSCERARTLLLAGHQPPWLEHPDLAVEAFRLSAFIRDDLLKNPDDINEVSRRIREMDEQRRAQIVEAIKRARLVALKEADNDNASRQQVVMLRQLLRKRKKTPSLVQMRGQIDYRRLLRVFPCWIMSIEDVARIFPLEAGLFDYLIVDEASQCNQAAALHLAYRARRLVVVGDRQQLNNPQVRFLSDEVVRFLLSRHGLDKHPRAEFLHGRESLLSLTEAASNTTAFLNEHFRCEPPIIAWSNKHFYSDALRILTPIRARRFTPVAELRVVLGADDDLDQRHNRPEAAAVVAEVKRLVASGEADGLTIGVLSPFEAQATLLHNRLHEAFADQPERLKQHELIASTADGFQGDERDIILYSFRYGPSTSPGTIRAIELERERLNVAFSRARRKAICFVSRPPEAFPKGLIRDFLEHVAKIQRDGRSRLERFDDRFDSEFERQVCVALRGRGIEVLTQVPCGPFFIDLVLVDRAGRRLAVECDGDFHYEDSLDLRPEDYQRQEILERADWTVHRIAARRFYANPEVAIDKVLRDLAQQPADVDRVVAESTIGVEEEPAE